MESDSVANPSHYNFGKYEVIEIIEDQKLNFNRGNAIKYICRAGRKNKDLEIEDINKAIWYLTREAHLLMCEQRGAHPKRPNEMQK